jgi:hypothetical protein
MEIMALASAVSAVAGTIPELTQHASESLWLVVWGVVLIAGSISLRRTTRSVVAAETQVPAVSHIPSSLVRAEG